jgi:hypothetical protein
MLCKRRPRVRNSLRHRKVGGRRDIFKTIAPDGGAVAVAVAVADRVLGMPRLYAPHGACQLGVASVTGGLPCEV